MVYKYSHNGQMYEASTKKELVEKLNELSSPFLEGDAELIRMSAEHAIEGPHKDPNRKAELLKKFDEAGVDVTVINEKMVARKAKRASIN